MITIHHLETSRSERVVWLMEELGLPYELKTYARVEGSKAPPAYKALHPLGKSPTISDGDTVLAESAAILEYLIHRHGGGRLSKQAGSPDYARYLHWLHFAEGSLMSTLVANFTLMSVPGDAAAARLAGLEELRRGMFRYADQALAETPYFAGEDFTAADIMMVFPLATLPGLLGWKDVAALPHVQRYLDRIRQRPAYVKAMALAGAGAVKKTGG